MHLEYIAAYRTPKKAKPLIFPVGDFHVKVIFEEAADFPDFIDFLMEANRILGSTWFTSLRLGGWTTTFLLENLRTKGDPTEKPLLVTITALPPPWRKLYPH